MKEDISKTFDLDFNSDQRISEHIIIFLKNQKKIKIKLILQVSFDKDKIHNLFLKKENFVFRP